jgi:hypothetical protein
MLTAPNGHEHNLLASCSLINTFLFPINLYLIHAFFCFTLFAILLNYLLLLIFTHSVHHHQHKVIMTLIIIIVGVV